MVIQGTVACKDVLIHHQDALVDCKSNSDTQQSDCFIIGRTLTKGDTPSFYQGQLLDSQTGLNLSLMAPRLIGWTVVDSTFIDGTYSEPRPYNPVELSYGIFSMTDNTTSQLEGYRFREPLNPKVGQFWANMETPSDVGPHKIQWLYKKDQSSATVAVNQYFTITSWGNQQPVTTFNNTTNQIRAIPSVVDKYLGDSLVIGLTLNGVLPSPLTFQWLKGGQNLEEGGKFTGTKTDTLTITDISMSEGTYYACIVGNVLISTQCWVIIVIP